MQMSMSREMTLAETMQKKKGGAVFWRAWDVSKAFGYSMFGVDYSYIAGYWCAHHNPTWVPHSQTDEEREAWYMGYADAQGDMELA